MPARHFDGRALRAARREADLTAGQLAESIGVARPQISKWETGASFPSMEKFPAIAEAVGKPIDVLFPRDGEPDLLDLRCDAGLTQKEAASRIGTSHIPVSNAERGRRRLDPAFVPPLAEAYGVSEEALRAAEDRSFGVFRPATPATVKVPQTLAEKITYLLETTYSGVGTPSDAEIADRVNAAVRRELLSPAQFTSLRTAGCQPSDVFSTVADETAFYEALASMVGVTPMFFRSDDAVARQVAEGIMLLSAGRKGVALAARGAEELGLSPAVVSKLAEVIAQAGAEQSPPAPGRA
ncbi:helix-turn-helix domain-containing protein [Streptomyces sp. NPDC014983]|uniref:helix-turn-helix domain-containing protein n=1 Tax=Streptomyces sp. NPDC014983 TaxID=3364933 RepID=UPI0036F7E3A2